MRGLNVYTCEARVIDSPNYSITREYLKDICKKNQRAQRIKSVVGSVIIYLLLVVISLLAIYYVLSQPSGYYVATAGQTRYQWVNEYSMMAEYEGNNQFKTADGNMWNVTGDKKYTIGKQYQVYFQDNGTPKDIMDDVIEAVN